MKQHSVHVCYSTPLCGHVDCPTCPVSTSADRKRWTYSVAPEKSCLSITKVCNDCAITPVITDCIPWRLGSVPGIMTQQFTGVMIQNSDVSSLDTCIPKAGV
jgi:hypothetical protein